MDVHNFLGILPGDYGSFVTNNCPPDPERVTIDIYMADMSAHDYYSDLYGLSDDTSKHTKTLFSIVIGQGGKKTCTAMVR